MDQDQLERFDDLFEGADLEDQIEIWSHAVATSLRNENEVLSILLMDQWQSDTIIAPSAWAVDEHGDELAAWPDGLPVRIHFQIPKGCRSFTIRTPPGSVTQGLSEVFD